MKKYQISTHKKIHKSSLEIMTFAKELDKDKIHEIETLINYFNQEYVWKDMFTVENVIDRLQNNQKLFILYSNKIAIGYVFFKELNSKTCFGYNLYVTKKIKRPKYSAIWFYKKVTEYMLCHYEKINVEIEDWNKTIIDIVEEIGYYENM